jgi:hypothetical protein
MLCLCVMLGSDGMLLLLLLLLLPPLLLPCLCCCPCLAALSLLPSLLRCRHCTCRLSRLLQQSVSCSPGSSAASPACLHYLAKMMSSPLGSQTRWLAPAAVAARAAVHCRRSRGHSAAWLMVQAAGRALAQGVGQEGLRHMVQGGMGHLVAETAQGLVLAGSEGGRCLLVLMASPRC